MKSCLFIINISFMLFIILLTIRFIVWQFRLLIRTTHFAALRADNFLFAMESFMVPSNPSSGNALECWFPNKLLSQSIYSLPEFIHFLKTWPLLQYRLSTFVQVLLLLYIIFLYFHWICVSLLDGFNKTFFAIAFCQLYSQALRWVSLILIFLFIVPLLRSFQYYF